MKQKLIYQLVAITATYLFLQSCAPVFSELQSARTVGKNNFEATPMYSSVSYSEDNQTDKIQNHIGVQLAYGLSPKIDLRLRYEYIWLVDNDGLSNGVSVLGVGPKFSLLENKITFAVPIGRAFADGYEDSWELHPTFIFTYPAIKDKLDINLAPKYLITLCEDCDDLVAVNLGLAFSTDLSKWAIRPEYGILFNPGESGRFGQFSIGFSATIHK